MHLLLDSGASADVKDKKGRTTFLSVPNPRANPEPAPGKSATLVTYRAEDTPQDPCYAPCSHPSLLTPVRRPRVRDGIALERCFQMTSSMKCSRSTRGPGFSFLRGLTSGSGRGYQ